MSSRTGKKVVVAAAALLALALPYYVDGSWLLMGILAMAAAVGAIGLNLLVGSAGQLSLAHGFFVAVGAYTYCFVAGAPGSAGGGIQVAGLQAPSLLAAVVAVATAGLAGLLFSPVAGRIRGIYLGLASLALVFLGQHLLFNVSSVTGGFNGRRVPALEIAGVQFNGDEPHIVVFGVILGARERLWYVALLGLVLAYVLARRILAGRPGRALLLLRENEIAAASMGIQVGRYKGSAFVLSSMYAGLAGVLLALAFRRVVPEYFGLTLSIDYLAMVVIGGLGSVAGAVGGAVFITALPSLLSRYSPYLPMLAQPGEPGIDPGVAARFIYGAAVVAVLLGEPGGLSALARGLRQRVRRRWSVRDPTVPQLTTKSPLTTKGGTT